PLGSCHSIKSIVAIKIRRDMYRELVGLVPGINTRLEKKVDLIVIYQPAFSFTILIIVPKLTGVKTNIVRFPQNLKRHLINLIAQIIRDLCNTITFYLKSGCRHFIICVRPLNWVWFRSWL